uniref:Retrotransposon gag domain-containing protein n=1 Tax=Chara braunii TaxID=69332 RepID=A0A388LQZ5_CHABU
MLARLQALEKQPAAVAAAGPSTLTTRVQVLEDDVINIKRVHQDFRTSQQATNLQFETQVQAAATVTPAAGSSRRPPKQDDIPVFCDQFKTEPIPWWRQFTLRLDMHHVPNNDRHPCLYHRSGGAYQAWLDNILTSHGVAVSELHTKLTWQELTDAWHKRFQVEPPDLQAMDKLNKLHQNTLLSQDWITEFQRLASTPDLPLAFLAIKHLFIMRSCPALQNALTQIAETLDTSDKLFSTASRIILTNIEARNADRSSATTSGTQPKPKVACITSTEASTPNEGEVLAASRDGGRPRNNHGRDKTKTQSTSTPSTGSAADEPWAQYGLSANSYRTRLKYRYCLWCNSTIHNAAHCPTKGKPRQGK